MTAETAQTSPPPAPFATAGSDSFSATTETAPARTSCATATRTAMMAPMKTLCSVVSAVLLVYHVSRCNNIVYICQLSQPSFLQLHTSVKHTSGSVRTSSVSPSRGSAMVRTTAVTSRMKTPPTAPAGPVVLDTSNAATDAVSPRAGNATLTTTAVTTPMNH